MVSNAVTNRKGNRQATVCPDNTDRLIIGGNYPSMNRAISCWAYVIKNSMPTLERNEWNFLAEVLYSKWDVDLSIDKHDMANTVSDAQLLNRAGDKWFGQEPTRGSGQQGTNALKEKIEKMTWEECQYIRTAVMFFWSRQAEGKIDLTRDEWWTIPFRVQLLEEEERQ